MSEYNIDKYKCVSNTKVYGLDESIRRAKFPMSVNPESLSSDLTSGIKSLANSPRGSGHDQWLTGVIVQFDLTFSNKAWVEAERYHFFDFVSSQSTMHRITKFDLDDSFNEYVDKRIKVVMRDKIDAYNYICERAERGEEDAIKAKSRAYLEVLYNNPSGFQLTAGITTNYRQLKTIYAQRKNHRLPEWRTFCEWIEILPHSELMTGGDVTG